MQIYGMSTCCKMPGRILSYANIANKNDTMVCCGRKNHLFFKNAISWDFAVVVHIFLHTIYVHLCTRLVLHCVTAWISMFCDMACFAKRNMPFDRVKDAVSWCNMCLLEMYCVVGEKTDGMNGFINRNKMFVELLFNVSSTNSEQCQLCVNSSCNIDAWFLWKTAICRDCT